MIERAKELLEIFKAAIRFAVQSVFEPRTFVAEFFAGSDDARRWFDFFALVGLYVAAQVAGIALAAGPQSSTPATFWMAGMGLVALAEVFSRAILIFAVIRVLGGAASFAKTVQSLGVPLLAAALAASGFSALFFLTWHIGFAVLAIITQIVLGVPSSIVAVAAVHQTTVRKAAGAFVVHVCVLSGVVTATAGDRLARDFSSLTPNRAVAFEVNDCIRGTAEVSVISTGEPVCTIAERLTLEDGGSAYKMLSEQFKLGVNDAPDAGPGNLFYCSCPDVTADRKRRIAAAKVCVDGVKTNSRAGLQLKTSAILVLDAFSVAREECDWESLLARTSDYYRHLDQALAW